MSDLISVVIPCYNSAAYLEPAVESVLRQTHSNLECILVDDGSTDETGEICKFLMNRDERVRYLPKKNGGISSARNVGIRQARGTWIQLVDHDDWLDLDKFQFQLEFLRSKNFERNDNLILHTDFQLVYQNEEHEETKRTTIVSENFTNQQLLDRIMQWNFKPDLPVHTSSLLFHRNVFDRCMYNDREVYIFEDLDLYVRLLMTDIQFIYTPMLGSYYRQHDSNLTTNVQYNRESYLTFLESVHALDSSLLRHNPNMEKIIKLSLQSEDRRMFHRLTRINQDPVRFKYIVTRNEEIMNAIFRIRRMMKKVKASLLRNNTSADIS